MQMSIIRQLAAAHATILMVVLFSSPLILAQQRPVTVKSCTKYAKRITTMRSFDDFVLRMELAASEGRLSKQIINDCLQSSDGYKDALILKRMINLVKHRGGLHSVCEPKFIDSLIAYTKTIKKNSRRSKLLVTKQTHRLNYFVRRLAGQVTLACKISMEAKLVEAEEENENLIEALNYISDAANRNVELRPKDIKKNLFSPTTKTLANIFIAHQPKIYQHPENLVLLDLLKPIYQEGRVYLGVTLGSKQIYDEFMLTKRSCKMIDRYAQSSIYPIARLSWHGFMARDLEGSIDRGIRDSFTVQRWIKVIQYCQGILLVKAHVDLEQKVLVELQHEIKGDNQMLTVNVVTDPKLVEAIKLDEQEEYMRQCEQIFEKNPDMCYLPFHRFKDEERFQEFDEQLSIYTFSHGIIHKLFKYLNWSERTIAKHIKLRNYDKIYAQSLFKGQKNLEAKVQLSGKPTATHHVVSQPDWSNGLASDHHVGAITVVAIVGFYLITFILGMVITVGDKLRRSRDDNGLGIPFGPSRPNPDIPKLSGTRPVVT